MSRVAQGDGVLVLTRTAQMHIKHCFVIDDSDVIRKYTRLIFESLGYRVSESIDPRVAIERLQSDAADLVLVDWRIPDADMHGFIAELRKLALERRPYIIYVTTDNDYADVHLALKLGADAHLLKPFNRDIVEMKLHEIRVAA